MNKNNKTHEIQVHFMEGLIMSERLLKNMSKDFKFEVLARYFYYISTLNGFSFDDIGKEHRSFYYLISFVYLEEGRADNFLTSLICIDDVVYNKSVDEYISSVDHLWEAHE